jgi:hypothetical protein
MPPGYRQKRHNVQVLRLTKSRLKRNMAADIQHMLKAFIICTVWYVEIHPGDRTTLMKE